MLGWPWLLVTLFFVLGHTGLLWMQYGFRISMVWLVKLITDPFTDVVAYYPAAGQPTLRH